MAFRPDCDTAGAQEIAERILLGLSSQKMGLAGVELAVTIGIAALCRAERRLFRDVP
jgi:hypothetical protein